MPLQRRGATSFWFARRVGSPAEVDAVLAPVDRAGAKRIKTAQPAFWGGCAGYLPKPDGPR